MAPITRSKADKDVIENVVNNEAGTARNQDPNLEDLINRVSAIEGMPKTSMTYFTPGKESCTPK